MESSTKAPIQDDERKLISLPDLHAKFGWEEYVVLIVTLSISGVIGVFFAWKSRLDWKSYSIDIHEKLLFQIK